MAGAVFAAARARLAAALPDWLDASGDPHPRPQARLPWFAVSVSLSDPERAAMGSDLALRSGELVVTMAMALPPPLSLDAAFTHAATAAAAITAAPSDLGGLAWSILSGGVDVSTEAGEVRIARAELAFPLQIVG